MTLLCSESAIARGHNNTLWPNYALPDTNMKFGIVVEDGILVTASYRTTLANLHLCMRSAIMNCRLATIIWKPKSAFKPNLKFAIKAFIADYCCGSVCDNIQVGVNI